MPKRTSPAERTPVHVTMVTLDTHLAAAAARAEAKLKREIPGLRMSFHAAAHWASDPQALERCHADIADADLVFVSMIFTEDQIEAVRPALEARRDSCDAMACVMSAPAISELTRLGSLDMRKPASSTMEWLKKLRGKAGKSSEGSKPGASAGAKQMAMLRRLPQLLKFIPGTAQDLRAYLLAMNYWLLGSETNIQNLIRVLVNRYADAERAELRKRVKPKEPVAYPDVGVYHPRLPERISENPQDLPGARSEGGRVGLLLMRSYLLAENTAHYDAVIEKLEQRGLSVVPAFSSSLDARPAIDACFKDRHGHATVDAVVSLTGFSLVGGPAYNDCDAAVGTLEGLDVPYLSAQALEFQTIEAWEANDQGLLPLETVLMVAIPELDGATASMVYAGRGSDATANGAAQQNGHTANGNGNGARSKRNGAAAAHNGHGTAPAPKGNGSAATHNGTAAPENMVAHGERISALADRVEQLVDLRRRERAERRLGVVLFNFPPNAGAVGSAAHLSVFESLYNVLERLKREGYTVEVPESVDALRDGLLHGNADRFGTDANVAITVDVDDYVRQEPHLEEIENVWGPAPGRQLSDGRRLFVLGARFGNVFVGLQPGFGIEGDPMRLMFEGNHAPTHAFTAFYHFIKHEFRADALLHFGTHGALEFMPGKQVGMSGSCWPERLIGAIPNYYLYAANNPSEGTIAKRRANATVLTHLTPPLAEAGLYRELEDLRDLLDSFKAMDAAEEGRAELKVMIAEQAAALELRDAEDWAEEATAIAALEVALDEVEESLIPAGLHVIGRPLSEAARADMLKAFAGADGTKLKESELQELVHDKSPVEADADDQLARYRKMATELASLDELDAIVHALDGGYVAPVAGGDLVSNPDILPTGRNIHGFDPTRLPSAAACRTGKRLADKLLETQTDASGKLPEMIAMILWGTDNLKTEGVSLAQALWLMGAKPRIDSYGRLAGADLVSLEELGRPRVDVLVTLSGIFRDLLPDQIKLLAEAALKAASADEPLSENPIRKHALAFQQAHGVSLEAAAMRVFSNDNGAYGANVNLLVDSGLFQDDDELGHMFARRKCFAYGVDNRTHENQALMTSLFSDVDLTYQNLDSIELGVTTVDHYFDSLGGVSKAVELARGEAVPTYIGDQTQGRDTVRTLGDQVALETRTRLLNPRWYEELLNHGHEGVHQLQVHVTNTMGWSATTGQVSPWVYRQLSRTFVLDDTMRERLASLNPAASLKLANRLLEAHERNYWSADPEDLEALRRAEESLEDRLEGIEMTEEVAT